MLLFNKRRFIDHEFRTRDVSFLVWQCAYGVRTDMGVKSFLNLSSYFYFFILVLTRFSYIIHNKYYRNNKELKCDAFSEKILPHCLRATDTAKQKWFLTVNFPLLSTAKPKLTNNFQRKTTKKVPSPTQILEHCSCSFQLFFFLFLYSFLGNNLLYKKNRKVFRSHSLEKALGRRLRHILDKVTK